MNDQGFLEIISNTPIEEQLKRFEHINGVFMDKYFDLVWFARADEEKLMKEEIYEALKKIKEIKENYPGEVTELLECDSNWQHGFNSGVLAYSRFLASYIKDDLWPIEEDIDRDEEIIHVVDGKEYVLMSGPQNALESFPELDT